VGLDGRLELVQKKAQAANVARAVGQVIDEDDLARAFVILADWYPDSPETRRVREGFGEKRWFEMVEAARQVVEEKGLVL